MTTNDICNLVEDITDLCSTHEMRQRSNSLSSTSSSNTLEGRQISPPQSISRSTSIAAYLLRLRALNISGPVLSICNLNEALRREIGMTPKDWQLFSSLVAHLKRMDNGDVHRHSCRYIRSMVDLAGNQRHWHQPRLPQQSVITSYRGRPNGAGTWTSESILAAATLQQPHWHHLNDCSPSPVNERSGLSRSNSISNGDSASCALSIRQALGPTQYAVEEEGCHLSGGSCSVYSDEISYSPTSSSPTTVASSTSSPSIDSSLHSSPPHIEAATHAMMPNLKHWSCDTDM